MYEKILESLLSTSLSSLISNQDIEEIATELEDELQTIVTEKVDESKESMEEDYSKDITLLNRKIRKLEDKIDDMKNITPKLDSLSDAMTMEWVKENWEYITQMHDLNISGKQMLNHFTRKQLEQNKPEPINVKQCMSDIDDWMKKLHRRIVLVGRAASGKDYARKLFTDRNYNHAISYTTRPPRTGEVDGVDYFFLTEEKFKEMISNDEFYEYVAFNNWYYGTSNKQFYSDDIFIMTPHGISAIKPEDREKSFIIYFDIPYEIRKERLMLRSDADSVERRLQADDSDFKDFTDFDLRITTPEFDLKGFLKESQKNNN